jgi:hypothetical protein
MLAMRGRLRPRQGRLLDLRHLPTSIRGYSLAQELKRALWSNGVRRRTNGLEIQEQARPHPAAASPHLIRRRRSTGRRSRQGERRSRGRSGLGSWRAIRRERSAKSSGPPRNGSRPASTSCVTRSAAFHAPDAGSALLGRDWRNAWRNARKAPRASVARGACRARSARGQGRWPPRQSLLRQ